MATHSSILAWEIPGTEEPGGIQLQRIEYDLATEQQQQFHLEVSILSHEALIIKDTGDDRGRILQNGLIPLIYTGVA